MDKFFKYAVASIAVVCIARMSVLLAAVVGTLLFIDIHEID